MDFDNQSKNVVHHLLTREMTCLGYQDDFCMVSVLVCMVIYWTRPMMNHDISYRVIMIH